MFYRSDRLSSHADAANADIRSSRVNQANSYCAHGPNIGRGWQDQRTSSIRMTTSAQNNRHRWPIVALIPARGGSKRVSGKNMRSLGGIPLLGWTLDRLRHLPLLDCVVSTDDEATAKYAAEFGARIRLSTTGHRDYDPDIVWIRAVVNEFYPTHAPPGLVFVLLRPTSPFRTSQSIMRALHEFFAPDGTHDSLRAFRSATENPWKMWLQAGPGYPVSPLLDGKLPDGTPLHSAPSQRAPEVLLQTSSLEIFWGANVWTFDTLHGRKVIPFFPDELNGFSIDTEADWKKAEELLASGQVVPPPLSLAALPRIPSTG